MVPALNAKERNKAFWKFILFFGISVVVIVMAVFVNFVVPQKENKILKEKAKVYQAHTSAEEKFAAAVQETNVLLDSLDKPGVNELYINQMIGNKISEMTALQTNNSEVGKSDKLFLDILLKYQQTKSKLAKLGNASEELEKAKRDLNQCRQDLNGANQTISLLQRNSGF